MMDAEQFRRELALLSQVEGMQSLPRELRQAAENSTELFELVSERIQCDRLLGLLAVIDPPAIFVETAVQRALGDAWSRAPEAPLERRRRLRVRSLVAAAALLMTSLFIGLYHEERGTLSADAADPAMLARLDLFLDWDELQQHREDLDLLACNELAEALEELVEESDGPK